MVAFGLFRRAVRDPGYRTNLNAPPGSVPVTPNSTFRRAICTYHDVDADAARAGIRLTADYWTKVPRGKTLARNYRQSLERYFTLDAADGRASYDTGVKQPITIAGEEMTVYIDALVTRGAQHTARVVLWDVPLPSEIEAATMGAPVMQALEAAVGEDRAHSVEFWHLRSGTVLALDKPMAHGRAGAAADAVRRAAGR